MIRKFLAATAVAATMSTGAAHAVVILSHGNVAGAGEIAAATVLAQEASLSTVASRTATFGLRLTTTGTIPPGQNVFVRINVTGGVWAAPLTGGVGEVVLGAAGATVNDQSTNSVRYLMTTDGGATAPTAALPAGQADVIEFRLPVTINGCNTLSFSVVEFQTEVAQTPIENGNTPASTSATAPPVSCLSAFNATLAPDVQPAQYTSLSFGATPAFSDFVVAAPDTANQATLGTYGLVINTAAVTSLNVLTPVAETDILGFTTTANFTAAAPAVESCDVNPTASTLFTAPVALATATTCTVVGTTAGLVAAQAGEFRVQLDSAAPIAAVVAQPVTVSSSVLNLNTASGLVATDPMGLITTLGIANGTPDVEDLVYAGAHFGPFDWVGDQTLPTNNVFRVTGLSSTGTLQARVVVQNSSLGVSGSYGFTIGGAGTTFTPNNGELIINAPRLNQIIGQNFGRADITLVFSRTDSQNNATGDLDVDRLMSSAAGSAVVSSYGDGANLSGTGAAGQTSPGLSVRDDQSNN